MWWFPLELQKDLREQRITNELGKKEEGRGGQGKAGRRKAKAGQGRRVVAKVGKGRGW